MIRHNPENERIKHAYLGFLREALGRDAAALDAVAMALHRFETFTGYLDFRTFDREQAGEFKAHLASLSSGRGGSPLSAATITATLRALKAFFAWLAEEKHYRGKIRANDREFLNPNANNARIASARRPSRAPALEDVERAIRTMPSGSDTEKRDRALVAAAILSGARISALASLKLKHLDLASTVPKPRFGPRASSCHSRPRNARRNRSGYCSPHKALSN